MQRGIATLEIIFAIMIIGVLMKFAVPKAAQIIDAVALDYETKKIYSELRFVQAMSVEDIDRPVLFIDCTKNYYQVFKDTYIKKPIREPHYFSHGVTIKLENKSDKIIKIDFDSEGKAKFHNDAGLSSNSDTLTLTSRLGKKKYIVIDSVGRIKGSLKNW